MSDPAATEPTNVASPTDGDAHARIAALAEGRAQLTEAEAGDVPAGGAGADSGASPTVRVDPESESAIPDESTHNDEPGIGTRRPD